MMIFLSSLFAGLLFGIGLMLSGMTDPAKVLGFLDLAGAWNPSLAFVMGGAVAITALAFAVANHRQRSILGLSMPAAPGRQIDRRLLGGSLLFGIGWGIAGFCPGPALVALGMFNAKALVFVLAMLAGMAVFELLQPRLKTRD